jgi:histone H3/H4
VNQPKNNKDKKMDQTFWRKCGSCKKDIGWNTIYHVCTVSGCQKFAYCSTDCWDIHNSIMNHKSAWAEENRSPSKNETTTEVPSNPRRIIVQSPMSSKTISSSMDHEILIVASKLKQYIKEKYDLQTSAEVMETLSEKVRILTDQAVNHAKKEGRKTVMSRDF